MSVMEIAITEMEIIMAVRLVYIEYARHFSVYRVQSDVARFLRPRYYCYMHTPVHATSMEVTFFLRLLHS